MKDYVSSGATPDGDLEGLVVLDVGCSTGWRFDRPEFFTARKLIGVDPDEDALAEGRRARPQVDFRLGTAERLPCDSGEADIYVAIVSLPYSDIPVALSEAYRVLSSGGRIHITLHDARMQMHWFFAALRSFEVKRVLDHGYVVAHSLWFALTGRCFSRPRRSSSFESFQTRWRMRRALLAAGFVDIRIRRARHFLIEAAKP